MSFFFELIGITVNKGSLLLVIPSFALGVIFGSFLVFIFRHVLIKIFIVGIGVAIISSSLSQTNLKKAMLVQMSGKEIQERLINQVNSIGKGVDFFQKNNIDPLLFENIDNVENMSLDEIKEVANIKQQDIDDLYY